MPRLARSRLTTLERALNPTGPPIGRLLFLLPDLWPDPDRAAFADPGSPEALEALVERRTGVRPTLGMRPVWAITCPAAEELLAMSDEEKAAFLNAHESRPLAPDRWDWRSDAAGDAP
jgi:hypothetical protein